MNSPSFDPRIDADKITSIDLVNRLHALAEVLAADQKYAAFAGLVGNGAAQLDAYQAGLALATPHPLSGHVLCSAPLDTCGART